MSKNCQGEVNRIKKIRFSNKSQIALAISMNQSARDYLASKDKVLQKIITAIPYPPIKSTHNVFHDLLSCTIEQQIHYRSTKKTFQKLLDLAGVGILTVDNFHLFEKAGLKNTKLSLRKYETIGGIVDFFEKHPLDWPSTTDGEVRKTLSQIKGIGNWTIDMILLYTLERPDVFPADDYHIKQVMTKLYEIDTTSKVKAQLKAVAENWSPYKSVAVKYLLAWKAAGAKK